MKASALIQKLQILMLEHGDLELCYLYSQNGCNDADHWFTTYDNEPQVITANVKKDDEYGTVSFCDWSKNHPSFYPEDMIKI